MTNLKLTCMSAKSVTAKIEQKNVLLLLHGVTVYLPTVVEGKDGGEQKLQSLTVGEFSLSLRNDEIVQVNDEVLRADKIIQKIKGISKP